MAPAQTWNELMAESKEASKEFAPLEAGLYNFIIKDAAKIGKTGKGHPKFTINPSVETGPRANARVFHDFNLSDSAFANGKHFFGALASIGLNESFFNTNPSQEQIAQALAGRRFTAEVFEEEGNDGVKRMKIRNIGEAVAPAGGLPGLGGPAAPIVASVPVAPAPVAAQPVQAASPWDNVGPSAPVAAPPAFNNTVPAPPVF